jgi:cell wall-associated NlpC family hydrolase
MAKTCRAIRGVTDLRREPAVIDTVSQLLFGELFAVEYFEGDWAFGRCVHDGVVGFAHREALHAELVQATHSISAIWAPVRREPDLRSKPFDCFTLGSRLRIVGQHGSFCSLDQDAWVHRAHVIEGILHQPDYIALAERLVGLPFVWGGRSTRGFDCTGVIQFVLALAGIPTPRDIPEQVLAFGQTVEVPRRGDLFFLERRGSFFHAGLFVSDTHVVDAGFRFASVSIQRFTEMYHLYRITEELNGTLAQFRLHIRRVRGQTGSDNMDPRGQF